MSTQARGVSQAPVAPARPAREARQGSGEHGGERGGERGGEHSERGRRVHEAAAVRLGELGQRYTPNRRAIVDALGGQASPVTLPELLVLRGDLRQSSTYRNLSVLADAGVVRRIVSVNEHAHYELAEDLTEHHHHLVCSVCGSITDVTLDARLERRLAQAFADAAGAAGFEAAEHAIDIHGRCAPCRA